MITSSNKCLTCRNWERTDDKLVGLCVVHQGYRFQLEDCAAYAFGEARERSAFTDIPKAKKGQSAPGVVKTVVLQNIDRIRAWKAEGKSYAWMAQTIGLPVNNSNSIARWLAKQGVM